MTKTTLKLAAIGLLIAAGVALTAGPAAAKDDYYPSTGGIAPMGDDYWPHTGGIAPKDDYYPSHGG
ncbi:hypothetical protein OHA77_17230 [Streptosporangium sp. NBC_01639]|uniref:hypothetical protein n=1 Tax=unclassified Streptosporangium TaxID=2632669 RepID=UPI002DD83A33|nr:hypothetical protein [Streptosporangium sp. NBC_01756]WSC83221.1 hypothetical protein OIE48_22675 [Streptosporangium sp. NBC_01756]WTD58202.1 hypothetical protein OHA77_17230 [Streptosporangium sp. NBC_01639]